MSQAIYHNITIEGNIGAGKTTIAEALAAELDARLILESFSNNPFLELFYSDQERYAFQVEMFFLAERYHQLSKQLLADIFHTYTVSDYLFSKSAIFSGINLQGSEHELFLNLYRIMDRFMPRPDILIYLHLPIDRIVDQINERGRPYEQRISREYLRNIERAYFNHLKEESRFPIIILEEPHKDERSRSKTLETVRHILSLEWPDGISHYSANTEN
jgi:deoxyadenosine/deoxycytidine kinase